MVHSLLQDVLLRLFRAFNCHFGWEAAVAISINLIHLEELAVENNREM